LVYKEELFSFWPITYVKGAFCEGGVAVGRIKKIESPQNS